MKSQIKVWTTSVKAWKALALYNPSISTLRSKWFLEYEFVTLLTVVIKSQIKVWTLLAELSKDSLLYNPSISALKGKWFLSMNLLAYVNRCNEITDQGLNYLGEAIKRLTSLQSIFLVFNK